MATKRFAFILRLWAETAAPEDGAEAHLRGSLEVVGTGHIYYFSSFDQIPHLLRQATAGQNLSGPDEAARK